MGVVERDEAREEREERERMKAKQSDERREGGREEERPKTTRTTTKIRKKNYREMIGKNKRVFSYVRISFCD